MFYNGKSQIQCQGPTQLERTLKKKKKKPV